MRNNRYRLFEMMGKLNSDFNLNEHKNIAGDKIIPNKFVYHQSSIKNRDSILSNGLIPSVGDCYFLYSKGGDIKTKNDCIPAIFATNSENNDDLYSDESDYDIYQIDTSKLNNEWYIDNHFTLIGEGYKHILTFNKIPIFAIELVHEGTE